jgi:hypothetical protein
MVSSGGSFVLNVLAGRQAAEKEIHAGTQSSDLPGSGADGK